MVETDIRNDRYERLHEVRSVELPADSDLDHRDIDVRFRKGEERESEQRFVIGRSPMLGSNLIEGRLHRSEDVGKVISGDRNAVDPRALGDRTHVRLGMETAVFAACRERRGDHRRRRTLAARSADMDGRVSEKRRRRLRRPIARPKSGPAARENEWDFTIVDEFDERCLQRSGLIGKYP